MYSTAVALAERARPGAPRVQEMVLTLPARFRAEAAEGFAGEFALIVDGEPFAIAIADGGCSVREVEPKSPTSRITTDADTWLALDAGHVSSIDAFLDDRIVVRGNVEQAVRMQSLFEPSARRRTPQDLDHITVRAGGHELSAFAFGEGPPVILLHGLAATKLSFMPLLPPLADRFRVVVPDLPGHGDSDKRRARYTPGYYADVVVELLDALGLDRATLLGNSMGGRVALEVAAEAPERVTSLVLLAPAVPGLPWPFYTWFARALPPGIGRVPLPLQRRVVTRTLRQLFARPDRLAAAGYLAGVDEFIRVYRSGRARIALLSAIRGLAGDAPAAFWDRMRDIEAPALILWGLEDRLVPERLGRKLAATLRRSELVMLPEVGHVPQFEVPEITRELVLEFLESLGDGPRRLRAPA